MPEHLFFFFRTRHSLIIGLVFMFNSIMFGNWVTRIPTVKDMIGLSEAELGLALLGAPVGALLIMPLVGWIISRLHSGTSTYCSAIFHFSTLILPAFADSFWTFALAMVLFGLSNAWMDISMNAAAASTEGRLQRPIMATCHGMWSFGAMLGSLTGSIMLALGVSIVTHLMLVAVMLILLTLIFRKTITAYREENSPDEKVFALPRGPLLILALMAFCIMLSEGAIADWSAVYMKETLKSTPFLTGIAYAGYALSMTIGRFSGDAVIPKVGKKKVVLWGAVIAAAGLAAGILLHDPYLAIIGFSLAGLGFSCIVPVLFISAAQMPGYASGTGIAAVTTLGYAGFLAGPPFIGFLAEGFSLSVGLGLVVLCSVAVSVLSMVAKFK